MEPRGKAGVVSGGGFYEALVGGMLADDESYVCVNELLESWPFIAKRCE